MKLRQPSELVVWTRMKDKPGIFGSTYGIRDEHGKPYTIKQAEQEWFAAADDGRDIDHNLTFARLVERNFNADAFESYLKDR